MDNKDYFATVPDIVLLEILSNLPGEDLLRASLVSARFYSMASKEQIWMKAANNKCGCYSPPKIPMPDTEFCKSQPCKAATMRAMKTHNQLTQSLTPRLNKKTVITMNHKILCLGKKLVICQKNHEYNRDAVLSAWSLNTFQITQKFVGPDDDRPEGAMLSPDDAILVSSSPRSLSVWDVASGQRLHVFILQPYAGSKIAYRSNSIAFYDKMVASTYGSFSVKVWDIEEGEECYTLPLTTCTIWTVMMNEDFLAYSDENNVATIFVRKTGEQIRVFDFGRGDGRFCHQRVGLHGNKLIKSIERDNNHVYLCDITTGHIIHIPNVPAMDTYADHHDRLLITHDGVSKAYSAVDGRLIKTWDLNPKGHKVGRNGVMAMLPHGWAVVTGEHVNDQGDRIGAIKLFHLDTGGYHAIKVKNDVGGKDDFTVPHLSFVEKNYLIGPGPWSLSNSTTVAFNVYTDHTSPRTIKSIIFDFSAPFPFD